MERTLAVVDTPDRDEREGRAVHDWRVTQLQRLGLHRILAEAFADQVDWHAVAKLIERGCPPVVALDILR